MRLIKLHGVDGAPDFYLNPMEIWGVGPDKHNPEKTVVRTVHPRGEAMVVLDPNVRITGGGSILHVAETPEEVEEKFARATM